MDYIQAFHGEDNDLEVVAFKTYRDYEVALASGKYINLHLTLEDEKVYQDMLNPPKSNNS